MMRLVHMSCIRVYPAAFLRCFRFYLSLFESIDWQLLFKTKFMHIHDCQCQAWPATPRQEELDCIVN